MKKTRILVLAIFVAALLLPASPSRAVDILDARGDLTVFGGWGARGEVCFGTDQEIIVGAVVGAGATSGPGVNAIHGAAPLLTIFGECAVGSFGGPGTANAGAATYKLVGTAPDGSSVDFAECVQTPGNSRACIGS